MSLTTGRGPFGVNPAGHFQPLDPLDPRMMPTPAAPPVLNRVVYVEPFLRRVRGVVGERTVIDSQRVVLVHRVGQSPAYAFPEADVMRELPSSPEPATPSYVRVPWDAVTSWFEEEEQVFGHPRNPYHRIDCFRAQRRLRVEVGTTVLVDTTDVICLYETARSPQLYVRREAVRMELLLRSQTVTYCPYKGHATHWSAEIDGAVVPDVAWSYDDPYPESARIAGLLAFYPERTKLAQDTLDWFSVPTPTTDQAPRHSEHEQSRR